MTIKKIAFVGVTAASLFFYTTLMTSCGKKTPFEPSDNTEINNTNTNPGNTNQDPQTNQNPVYDIPYTNSTYSTSYLEKLTSDEMSGPNKYNFSINDWVNTFEPDSIVSNYLPQVNEMYKNINEKCVRVVLNTNTHTLDYIIKTDKNYEKAQTADHDGNGVPYSGSPPVGSTNDIVIRFNLNCLATNDRDVLEKRIIAINDSP